MTQSRYTPEERAKIARQRGKELSAWRREHPLSDAERQKKSEEMRLRWAAMTPEQKTSFSELARKNTTIQMSDSIAREHLSQVVSEQHRKENYLRRFDMTPEIAAKISSAQLGKQKEWMSDPEKRAAASAKESKSQAERFRRLGGINGHELFREDVRKRALANSAEEGKTNPLRGRFETNKAALDWHLRDPRGVEHHFRNLNHFIRNHVSLFTQEQLFEDKPGKTHISNLLARLSPRNKFPTTCSQGWTWVLTPGEDDPRLITSYKGILE